MERNVNLIRLKVLLLALIGMGGGMAYAQSCLGNTQLGGGSGCPLSPYFYGTIVPSGPGASTTILNYPMGHYFLTPVLQGGCYTVTTCGCGLDTQLNAFEAADSVGPFAYDDDYGPNCFGLSASIDMLPYFSGDTEVDVRMFNCNLTGPSLCSLTVSQNNNLLFTSSAADMCAGDVRQLSATPAPIAFAPVTAGDSGTFSGPGVTGSVFTAPSPVGNSGIYMLTYSFGFCTTTQIITVYHQPSPALASGGGMVCGTSASILGNTPTFGVGQWSIAGPGVIANASDPATTVSGLLPGSPTTLYWTITNGPCSTVDSITLYVDSIPPVANCQAFTLELDTVGAATLLPTDVDNGSSDNCTSVTFALSQQSFTCVDSGMQAVTLTVTDSHGNSSTCTANVLILNPTITPTITQWFNQLNCPQTFSSYQWYVNGSPIPGATSSTHSATMPGNYYVTVVNANGCPGQSNTITYFVSTGTDQSLSERLKVHPNPAKGHTTVNWTQRLLAPTELMLMNLDGKVVLCMDVPQGQQTIDLELGQLAQGRYVISMQQQGEAPVTTSLLLQ